MGHENANKGYSDFVVTLVLLFPVVINSVKIIGNLILLILVFVGIYVFIKERNSPFQIPDLRLFSWLTMGYFLVMFFSIAQNEGFVDDLYHLGRKAHFALAPLIALAIYRVKFPINRFISSIKIGLIIIGTIIIYQYSTGTVRPSGMYNANIFGDLVLVMTFFSIVNWFEENTFVKFLTVISASFGVYAVILSGNRGTYLMFIILTITYCLILYKKYFYGDKKKKIFMLVVLLTIITIFSTQDKVQSGIQDAYSKFISYVENRNLSNSSPGLRIEMWSASIDAVKESPWLGYGYRNANSTVSNYVDKKVKDIVFSYTHLHNEYITNLVSAGVIGLIGVLALLFLPLWVFVQHFRNNSSSVYSVMGILLCISYAGIGMTHIAFGEEHVNAFYILFLAILLPKVIKERSYSY